jgi:hypothetical protein
MQFYLNKSILFLDSHSIKHILRSNLHSMFIYLINTFIKLFQVVDGI